MKCSDSEWYQQDLFYGSTFRQRCSKFITANPVHDQSSKLLAKYCVMHKTENRLNHNHLIHYTPITIQRIARRNNTIIC